MQYCSNEFTVNCEHRLFFVPGGYTSCAMLYMLHKVYQYSEKTLIEISFYDEENLM